MVTTNHLKMGEEQNPETSSTLIGALFNDSFGRSDYIAPNGTMTNER
jgi:hypothetical protein